MDHNATISRRNRVYLTRESGGKEGVICQRIRTIPALDFFSIKGRESKTYQNLRPVWFRFSFCWATYFSIFSGCSIGWIVYDS